jgi:G2/mitotic-specific cyclin 3/4
MIFDCCQIARKHHSAVFEKYSDKRYKRSATTVENKILKGFTLSFQQQQQLSLHQSRRDLFADEQSFTPFSGNGSLKMPIPIET